MGINIFVLFKVKYPRDYLWSEKYSYRNSKCCLLVTTIASIDTTIDRVEVNLKKELEKN